MQWKETGHLRTGAFFAPAQFFHAYLFGYLFWLGVALGSLALLMTQYLTGGAWGVMTRRGFAARPTGT